MRAFVVVSLLLMTQSNLCLGEARAVSQESAGQRVGAMTKHTVEKKVTEGFLFVEDRYVSLPYRVGFDENNVFINDNKLFFYKGKETKQLTSSLVSVEFSKLGLALLASFGALMLERQTVLSGGGPPFGCPLRTMVSPERT